MLFYFSYKKIKCYCLLSFLISVITSLASIWSSLAGKVNSATATAFVLLNALHCHSYS